MTSEAQDTMDNIFQELQEESINISNSRTVKAVTTHTLKQQYENGQEFSIDAEEVKTLIRNAWKQSEEFSSGEEVILSSSTQP